MSTTTLSKSEQTALAECEAIIERNLESFVDAGNALLRVRNEKLYRAEYGSFQEWCEGKWKISDRHARRMIDAAEVAGNLQNGPVGPVPTTERQARPLTSLVEPEEQQEAWQAAVQASANGAPTAREVEAVVEKMKPAKARPVDSGDDETHSEGLHFAGLAIDDLKLIHPNDTQRAEAFKKVTLWIARQEKIE